MATTEDEREEERADRYIVAKFRPDQIWRYIDPESNREHVAPLEALRALVKAGSLPRGSRVSRPLSSKWEAVQRVPELAAAFAELDRAVPVASRSGCLIGVVAAILHVVKLLA
jgi:hypothetical protein